MIASVVTFMFHNHLLVLKQASFIYTAFPFFFMYTLEFIEKSKFSSWQVFFFPCRLQPGLILWPGSVDSFSRGFELYNT